MRQSLSKNVHASTPMSATTPSRRPAVAASASALVLSAALVAAAVVDQFGVHSLIDHATAMYAPYHVHPSAGLLYGLLYTVGVVDALLWLPVVGTARSGRRFAPVLAVVMTVITALLALPLLVATEYGAQIFPPLWGALALLPPVAGVVAAVLLFRRR